MTDTVEAPTADGAPSRPHRSLWLREVLPGDVAQPPLSADDRADVAIVGGGFVGLWTAIRIKQRDPACDVALLEQDICGSGASGRNGGMVLSWWPKLASLVELCGSEEAVRLGRASEAAIDEISAFCETHSIDCEFRRGGLLWTATNPAHVGAWNGVVALSQRLGIDAFERIDAAALPERTGTPIHLAGVFEPAAATVQPAALARGLCRVALELGVRIFETTRVTAFTRDRPVTLRTDRDGSMTADRLVVAMNAWAAALPELRRSLVVMSSDIVATAPIPDQLERIGWSGGESIIDSQMMVDYYRPTMDGRIAFGKGTAGVAYGGRISPDFDHDPRRAAMAIADFRRYYPTLHDVPIEHAWGGPIDRTRDSVPLLGHLGGREHILYGVGWSGNGVGPSVVGGRILASLALGIDDEWSRAGLVDAQPQHFPPEPLRYIGAQIVRRAVISKESSEHAGYRPRTLATHVAKLAPAGLEDKN